MYSPLVHNKISYRLVKSLNCLLLLVWFSEFKVNRFLNMKKEDQQDATIRCLLLTSVSTWFVHHYAHLPEIKGPITAFGVLFWFYWIWLVAVVGRCLAGCDHYEGFCSTVLHILLTMHGHRNLNRFLFLTTKSISKRIYWDTKGKISNILNRFLHETLFLLL
jgi:hypothetical protein